MSLKPIILSILAMAFVVSLSNILVQHLIGNWLTLAAFTYPLAFLVTDVTNRNLGPDRARQVILVGFLVGVICSFIASQVTDSDGQSLTTLRIALGSGAAFVVAQLIDVSVFNRIKKSVWWKAPLVSSVVGSVLDTTIFFTIAFSVVFTFIDPTDPNGWALELVPLLGFGPVLPLWLSLAVADFMVKIGLAVVTLLPFGLLTRK